MKLGLSKSEILSFYGGDFVGYNSMSEEEIRAAVIEEGRKRFLNIGIANTQMNLIAKSVGISRSTLYLYFPSKVELVFHVARELLGSVTRSVNQHIDSANCQSGFSAVHEYLSFLLNFYRANTSIARFIDEFDSIYTGDYPDVEETRLYASDMAAYMNVFYARIARGQADGSIRTDLPANVLGSVLVDGLYGFIQRLFPRKSHIEKEHDVSILEISDVFLSFLENSVKT